MVISLKNFDVYIEFGTHRFFCSMDLSITFFFKQLMYTRKLSKVKSRTSAGALYVLIFRLKLSVCVLAIMFFEKILWI